MVRCLYLWSAAPPRRISLAGFARIPRTHTRPPAPHSFQGFGAYDLGWCYDNFVALASASIICEQRSACITAPI